MDHRVQSMYGFKSPYDDKTLFSMKFSHARRFLSQEKHVISIWEVRLSCMQFYICCLSHIFNRWYMWLKFECVWYETVYQLMGRCQILWTCYHGTVGHVLQLPAVHCLLMAHVYLFVKLVLFIFVTCFILVRVHWLLWP